MHDVDFFRELGYFADLEAADQGAVMEELTKRDRARNNNLFSRGTGFLADIRLVCLDTSRTWSANLYLFEYGKENRHSAALSAWAQISLGTFDPQQISESAMADSRVSLSFTVKGTPHTLVAQTDARGRIDVGLLAQINERFMPGTGMKFCVYMSSKEYATVTVLTPDEQGRLRKERRWPKRDL